ncbi:putative transmembrane protein [Cryptosporidium felis]|nr:putative transmembrane protein [Cryptosporidium felis]
MDMYRHSGGLSSNDFHNFEINRIDRDQKSVLWSQNITCEEKAITIVKRLYYSDFSKYLYLGIFLLNIFVLVIGLFKHQSGSIFAIFLETIITITLTFEVIIKLFLMKKRFFSTVNNLFDFFVALTCLTLLFLNGDIHRLFSIRSATGLKNNQVGTIDFDKISEIDDSVYFSDKNIV